MAAERKISSVASLKPRMQIRLETNDGRPLPATAPMTTSSAVAYVPTTVEIPITTCPPGLLAMSGSQYLAIIPRATVPWISKMHVLHRVTSSTAVTYLPTAFWYNKIRVYQQGSASDIKVQYPIPQFIENMTMIKDDEKTTFRNLGLSDSNPFVQRDQTPAGVTEELYYPLTGPWNIAPIYFGAWKDDLIIAFTPVGNPLIVGTPGNVQVAMSLVIESFRPPPGDAFNGSTATYVRYLEPLEVQSSNRTLSSGSTTKIDLSSVQGLVCNIQTAIYPTGTSIPNGALQPYGLGEDFQARFDVQTESGVGLLGDGGPAPLVKHVLKEFQDQNRANSFLHAKKFLSYVLCNNSSAAAGEGELAGWLNFPTGSRYQLALTPGSSTQISQVQTTTLSLQPTAGHFIIRYKTNQTESLTFNTSAANIATAINNLSLFKRDGLTVVVNQALSAGTSVTFTISSANAVFQNETLQVISFLRETGGANVMATTAITTPGNLGGFVTGAYDIYAYAMMWRELQMVDGRVKSVRYVASPI